MAKLADAHALGACEATRGGSNPPTRTKNEHKKIPRLNLGILIAKLSGFNAKLSLAYVFILGDFYCQYTLVHLGICVIDINIFRQNYFP